MSNALRTAMESYSSICSQKLTAQQETYVLRRSVGMNPMAAARMAGFSDPKQAVLDLTGNPLIEDAIAYMRETQRQTAINAGAIEFTKDDATTLYLAAHSKAETAAEEIRAVDSLVKLHGLAAPEKKEVTINSREQLSQLSDDDLMRMAGKEYKLDPDQYTVVEDE